MQIDSNSPNTFSYYRFPITNILDKVSNSQSIHPSISKTSSFNNLLCCFKVKSSTPIGVTNNSEWPECCFSISNNLYLTQIPSDICNIPNKSWFEWSSDGKKLQISSPMEVIPNTIKLNLQNSHRYQIQNITHKFDLSNHQNQIFSVDSAGFVISSIIRDDIFDTISEENPNGIIQNSVASSKFPIIKEVSVAGNCSLSVNPRSPDILATCRYHDKLVTIYNGDRINSSFKTLKEPTDIKFSCGGLLVITEGNSISVWDLRLPHSSCKNAEKSIRISNSACIKRHQVGSSSLSAIATLNEFFIGVGGEDRCVSTFDLRRDGATGRWNNCLKRGIYSITFSSLDNDICMVSGRDNEISCGRWDGTKSLSHLNGPRVESKWIGFVHTPYFNDAVFAMSSYGKIYSVHNLIKVLE